MKKILSMTAGMVLVWGTASAQEGPGPGEPPAENQHSWSNSLNYSHSYSNVWGPGTLEQTKVPKAWSNQFSHSYAGQSAAGGGGQVQNRFGKPEPLDAAELNPGDGIVGHKEGYNVLFVISYNYLFIKPPLNTRFIYFVLS